MLERQVRELRLRLRLQGPQQVLKRQVQQLWLGFGLCGRQVFERQVRKLWLGLGLQGRPVLEREVLEPR